MGITLIARIYKPTMGNPQAEDKGDFLKSATLESGGTNGSSGYTLQLKKSLPEGWYAIFEDRDNKPSYHIFYLAADDESPVYDDNGNKIAVLATKATINSKKYKTLRKTTINVYSLSI